jgi:protein-disulfide isomerase
VKWQSLRPWLGTIVRLFLGAIWIWASWSKLRSPRTFVQAVRAYDVTPEWLSKAIGYGLPVLEFSLGVLLILGIVVRMSAIVSTVLFVVFLIGVAQASARGLKLDCGCFGGGGETVQTHYTIEILRDIGLLALAVYLVLWSFTRVSVEEFLARNDYVEPPSAKRMRSEDGRRKYQTQLEQKRKDARERTLWVNGSLAVVVVLVTLVGIGVQSGRAKIAGSLFATNAKVTTGVVFGKAAAAKVDIYEDFQCPNCRDFENAVGATMDADVRANRAQVHYHPLAILDSSSNNSYSSRAANASICASDISVEAFVKYHNYLFQKSVQPAEGAGGRSDTLLDSYAQKAGLPQKKLTTFDQCVLGQTHKALVQAITEDASKNGINATPTIKVNGKKISSTLDAYQAAVAKALQNGPAPNPSKTPSPTPTAASPSQSATTTRTPTPSPTK